MKEIKKYSINHFLHTPLFSNGVTNYIKEVNRVFDVPYEEIIKPYEMSMPDFRKYIYNKVINLTRNDNIIIEAAESQSSTLLIPRDINVHIRLHCPFHLYKRIINEEPDESRYSDECRAISKAKAVSSPSYGMLKLLKEDMDIDEFHVYKNPIQINEIYYRKFSEKDIDVIFFSRFNNLKGIEYIDELVSRLPANTSIYIVGKQEKKIKLATEYPNVIFVDHIEGNKKFEILARAKVAISLSKFENCSMAILEAISVYTPVVCWDVGGNSEIAPPSILKVAPLGDLTELSNHILNYINNEAQRNSFEETCSQINADFKNGLTHVENYLLDKTETIYRGLSYKREHDLEKYIPYEFLEQTSQDFILPLNITIITTTVKCSKYFHLLFENTNINLTILYSGKYGNELKSIPAVVIDNINDTEQLLKHIKNAKSDLVIFDESMNVHINDIYKVNQKSNKAFLYCFASPINSRDYILDPYGFGIDSDLMKRKLMIKEAESLPKLSPKILIWAPNLKVLTKLQKTQISEIIKSTNDIDIVASNDLINSVISQEIDVSLNIKSESTCIPTEYTDILMLTDYKIHLFLQKPCNIYLSEKSFFKSKNIESPMSLLSDDSILHSAENKKIAYEFLEMKSCSIDNLNRTLNLLSTTFKNKNNLG
jgi:glycosyltransferase involved in cell wall biosynthesis